METLNDEVDFKFIMSPACQNYKTTGYVPSKQSGATVCAGFDLKAQSPQEMRKNDISEATIQKLKPYIGLKGDQAKLALTKSPLSLSINEQMEINRFMINKYTKRVKYICAKNQIDYNSLPKSVKTILFSRVIHSWSIEQNLLTYLKLGNLEQFACQLEKLKNFGSRGKNQASYLRSKQKEQ